MDNTNPNNQKLRDAMSAVCKAFASYAGRLSGGTKFAWRSMLRDLECGKTIPGVGTWRDVWEQDFSGQKIPASYPCGWVPKGWQYANLMRAIKKEVPHA